MITFVFCFLMAVFLYIGVPRIFRKQAQIQLKHKAVHSKSLVLTFDDGPGSRLTPAILDILMEYNAKATFFLLGRNIAGREAIVRRIAEAGHEICSHGYDHLHYWKVGPIRAIRDIKRGWQAIDSALGLNRGKYPFRPPYGKLNIVCLMYLWFCQVPIIYWTVDSGDTWYMRPDRQRTASLVKKVGGAVTLGHDFDWENDCVDDIVLDSLRSTLSMVRNEGMRVLTITQLVNKKRQS